MMQGRSLRVKENHERANIASDNAGNGQINIVINRGMRISNEAHHRCTPDLEE